MMFQDLGPGWVWMALLMGAFYALVIVIVVLAARSVIHAEKRARNETAIERPRHGKPA